MFWNTLDEIWLLVILEQYSQHARPKSVLGIQWPIPGMHFSRLLRVSATAKFLVESLGQKVSSRKSLAESSSTTSGLFRPSLEEMPTKWFAVSLRMIIDSGGECLFQVYPNS